MSKVKWGILSTANIGQTQVIPAINRSKLGEAIAIASLSGRAQEAADKLGIPKVYESYEALLSDEEIDAVYIPLPNHLHAKWVMEAAKAGKHVLVEKPASLTAHEMEEMLDVCNRHGVIFMEAFMYQFHAQHKRVRDILKTGEIGEVKYMYASHSFFLDDEENIRLSPEKGGGALYDVGCYNIHAFRHILQAEPKEVRVYSNMNNSYHLDMTTTGHLWVANGVQAMFDCSFEMKTRDEYRVVGTKGEIICQHAYRPDRKDHKGTLVIKTNEETRKEIISCDQYLMQVEHFAECVIEGKQPQYTGTDTLQNMKVIDACYESIRTNQTVTLL